MSNTFTLDNYGSSHFLNDVLANTKTKPSSLLIHSVSIHQFAKIMEKFANILLFNTNTGIFNMNFKRYAICFLILILNLIISLSLDFLIEIMASRFNFYLQRSFWRGKFQWIWHKIQKYLCISSFISINLFQKR
jgi:hypothetical protein